MMPLSSQFYSCTNKASLFGKLRTAATFSTTELVSRLSEMLSTALDNRSQVVSPNSALGQSMSNGCSLSADEQLDIMLRGHERQQQILSAEHVHPYQQVFRALQDPQQHHFPQQAPPALTSSASPPPSVSPLLSASSLALRIPQLVGTCVNT